jgi:hypothetical protein
LLFIEGRLYFYHVTGVRAAHNGGSDSVLISYDQRNTETLMNCGIRGQFILL